MSDRKSLVSTLWLTTCLALLASVLVVSIQTLERVTVSSRSDYLRRDFTLPSSQPTTGLIAALTTDAVLELSALAPDNEEQDRVVELDLYRVSFLLPCSFHKVHDRQWITPRSILSYYPLRS